MPLTTQADVQKYLQVVFDNTPEPVVDYLIEGADALVDEFVGWKVEADPGFVETIDPPYTDRLYLSRYVQSVATVTVDGVAQTEGVDDDFLVYDRRKGYLLRRPNSVRWHGKPQGIVVTYDSGYDPFGTGGSPNHDLPADIRDAAASLVAGAFQPAAEFANTPSDAGFKSEKIGDYSYVTVDGGVPYVADRALKLSSGERTILARHRRRVLV